MDGWMDRRKKEKERKGGFILRVKCLQWAQFDPPEINCFKGISVIVDSDILNVVVTFGTIKISYSGIPQRKGIYS